MLQGMRSCLVPGALGKEGGRIMSTMAMSLGKIRGVLLDLSGTLHIENAPTFSAITALRRLRETGLPLRFITNTTKESKHSLLDRLRKIGFDIHLDEVFTSLTAARKKVEQESLRPLLLLEESAKEDFEGVSRENPDSVVVGLAPSMFDYQHMNEAFRLLLDGGKLIAIHKTRYFERGDGLALGPGPFVMALEFASGRVAEVVGKPEPAFFSSVLRDIRCEADEAVMVGDDVYNDIHGAQVVGMRGILVKTGKYRSGDETSIQPPPFAVCENFAEAVDIIINSRNS